MSTKLLIGGGGQVGWELQRTLSWQCRRGMRVCIHALDEIWPEARFAGAWCSSPESRRSPR